MTDNRFAIRIQPKDVDIPDDDPFRNDLLGRKESAEFLTSIIASIDGPCVLAIDAPWGTGKTTFLNMWSQHLRNLGFPVVKFNAWETDFTGDPFVALSSELTEQLGQYGDDDIKQKITSLISKAEEVAIRAIPGAVRLLTAGILDLRPVFEKEVGDELASYAKDQLTGYQGAKDSVGAFRDLLSETADSLWCTSDQKPLVIVIDELDRCRPSYAVELLEVAKHLFSVDGVIFVLTVDWAQLAHSVKALYGNDFDAQGYLGRFFDVDFRLPSTDREVYFDTLISSLGIDRLGDSLTLLGSFFCRSDLGLRTITQAIHRLALAFASLSDHHKHTADLLVVLLLLRTLDPDLYRKFIRFEASDLEVIEEVFSKPGLEKLRTTLEGNRFEAVIIRTRSLPTFSLSYDKAPLLRKYQEPHGTSFAKPHQSLN